MSTRSLAQEPAKRMLDMGAPFSKRAVAPPARREAGVSLRFPRSRNFKAAAQQARKRPTPKGQSESPGAAAERSQLSQSTVAASRTVRT